MRFVRSAVVACTIFFAGVVLEAQTDSAPTDSRPTSQPLAVDPLIAAARAAADYSEKHGGKVFFMQKDGRTIAEHSAEGWSAKKPHYLASGTKSFWGVLAVAAVEDGILSLDEKISDTLTDWQSDADKKEITVRQLLTLTSGIDPLNDELQSFETPDKYAVAVTAKMLDHPGEKFRYGPAAYYSFGAYLEKKVAPKYGSAYDYLSKRILEPLGIKVGGWRKDGAGHHHLPHGAELSAEEWVKFGEMLRCGGKYGEKTIVKKESLAACVRGTKANPGYGLTFWLNAAGFTPFGTPQPALSPEAPADFFQAAGGGGQRLIVIPSLGLVIVRLADGDRGFNERDFLAPIMAALGRRSPESQPTSRPVAGELPVRAKEIFRRLDKDGNGLLAGDELNERQRRLFLRADRDGDDAISEAELAQTTELLRGLMERRRDR